MSDNIKLQDYSGNIKNNHPASSILELSIASILELFLDTKKSLRTKKSYFTDLKNFFEQYKIYDWDTLLRSYWNYEITDLITEYINNQKKIDPQDPNRILNPRTVNRKAYALSSFFKFLQKKYKLNYNPVLFEAINTPRHSTTASINSDELKNILYFVKQKYQKSPQSKKLINFRNYLIFCFLSLSLRRNEVSKLRWQDINKQEKYIQVMQKWSSYKLIPIPSNIYELLMSYQTTKYKLWYKSDYIFSPFTNNKTKDTSKPLTSDYIYNIVIKIWNEFQVDSELKEISSQLSKLQNKKKYLTKKIKINNDKKIEENLKDIDSQIQNLKSMKKELMKNNKQISCHSFRKTFVEQAILRWDDFVQIQNATGHANPNMISYYQTINKTRYNSINNLDELF